MALAVVLGVWLAHGAAAPRALAAAGPPSVTVSPGTVALAPGQATDVIVVISNGTDQPVGAGTLTLPTDEAVEVTNSAGGAQAGEVAVPALAPGAQFSFDAQVARTSVALPPGALPLRWEADAEASTAVGVISVTDRERTNTAPPVEVTTKSAGSKVDEMNSETIMVIVRNTSPTTATLCAITVTTPGGVTAIAESPVPNRPCGESERTVPSGDVLTLPYTVTISGDVQPGKEILLFDVHTAVANGASGGGLIESHVLATADIETGVFGEAWALAVGVPVFFLLPGFLVLLAMSMVAHWLKASEDISSSWLGKPTDARFLLWAVTLSAVTALWVYPWLTDLLGERRSYLDGYAFKDIVLVWSGAIVAGVAAGAVWAAGAKVRRDRAAARSIDAVSTPIELLEYLSRNHISLLRSRLKLEGFSAVAVLVTGNLTDEDFWVSPVIMYSSQNDEVLQSFTGMLDGASARDVLRWMESHPGIELGFAAAVGFAAPTKVGVATKPQVVANNLLMIEAQ